MKQRLWLISEVFYPDTEIATGNIATEIALKFSEYFDVHVICGPAGYEKKITGKKDESVENSITIHRIHNFNYDKNKSYTRLLRVVGISVAMFVKGWKIKAPDKAFVISNPAFITPLFAFLKRVKKFDYTMLLHDVFPENLVPGGYTKSNSLTYKLVRWFFVKSRNRADHLLVLGRDMKSLICSQMPKEQWEKVQIVPNWADIECVYPLSFAENEIVRKNGLTEKIVILFAGNHGVLQNLLTFLKIIEKVNNPDLHFIFAGGGATKEKLIEYAKEKNLLNITFLPSFPRSELNNYQNACTIGLVSLSDSLYGVGVPSKSYNIYSAGNPVLFIGNIETEIARFVKENNIGWAFSYQQEEAIIDFLNSLHIEEKPQIERKGMAGREIVKNEYNKEYILQRFVSIVKAEK